MPKKIKHFINLKKKYDQMGSRIIFAILLFSLTGMVISPSFAQSNEIPPWIKSNIQWWHQEIISDTEFVAALEFLISDNIIKSPRITIVTDEQILAKEKRISDDITVPSYFKTNALWWSEGIIDDTTFLNGVEFLIEEEIINSPSIKVVSEITNEKSMQIV